MFCFIIKHFNIDFIFKQSAQRLLVTKTSKSFSYLQFGVGNDPLENKTERKSIFDYKMYISYRRCCYRRRISLSSNARPLQGHMGFTGGSMRENSGTIWQSERERKEVFSPEYEMKSFWCHTSRKFFPHLQRFNFPALPLPTYDLSYLWGGQSLRRFIIRPSPRNVVAGVWY